MDDIDRVLARLADMPAPAELDGMEARVLARLSARPTARTGLHIGAVATAALAIGVVGGGVPARASESGPASLSPLAGGSPLAPSALLAGEP